MAELWDMSVGGSSISGENSQEAAERETKEEIGITIDDGTFIPYYKSLIELMFDNRKTYGCHMED